MPTCAKCNDYFPVMWRNPETKKKHNLSNRKFCVNCSPFNKHNTRDIVKVERVKLETHIICFKCKETKERSAFYNRGGKRDAPHPYCKSCANKGTVNRQQKLKAKAIEYKGGKCSCCGYDKYQGALEFHHVDPTQKDFSLAHCRFGSFERIKPELDKCILVCANCHRELHANLIQV